MNLEELENTQKRSVRVKKLSLRTARSRCLTTRAVREQTPEKLTLSDGQTVRLQYAPLYRCTYVLWLEILYCQFELGARRANAGSLSARARNQSGGRMSPRSMSPRRAVRGNRQGDEQGKQEVSCGFPRRLV